MTTEIVPRYIVHTTKIRDLVVDFEIELVEGRYMTDKFDIAKFVEPVATGDRRSPRTWDPYSVHETRDETETWRQCTWLELGKSLWRFWSNSTKVGIGAGPGTQEEYPHNE